MAIAFIGNPDQQRHLQPTDDSGRIARHTHRPMENIRPMTGKTLANALLFIVGWLTCMLAGHSFWLLIPGAALLIHFCYVSSWAAEGKLVVSCMLVGTVLDSLMLQMGWLQVRGHEVLAPLWMMLGWALLGTTLNHALHWSARPWWRASLLGAIIGTLFHAAVMQREDVAFAAGLLPGLLIVALAWAITLPLLHGFAQLYREQYAGRS